MVVRMIPIHIVLRYENYKLKGTQQPLCRKAASEGKNAQNQDTVGTHKLIPNIQL